MHNDPLTQSDVNSVLYYWWLKTQNGSLIAVDVSLATNWPIYTKHTGNPEAEDPQWLNDRTGEVGYIVGGNVYSVKDVMHPEPVKIGIGTDLTDLPPRTGFDFAVINDGVIFKANRDKGNTVYEYITGPMSTNAWEYSGLYFLDVKPDKKEN